MDLSNANATETERVLLLIFVADVAISAGAETETREMAIEHVLEELTLQCWRFAAQCEDEAMAGQARRLGDEAVSFLDHIVGIFPEDDDFL